MDHWLSLRGVLRMLLNRLCERGVAISLVDDAEGRRRVRHSPNNQVVVKAGGNRTDVIKNSGNAGRPTTAVRGDCSVVPHAPLIYRIGRQFCRRLFPFTIRTWEFMLASGAVAAEHRTVRSGGDKH
jgi:hypothetical protein